MTINPFEIPMSASEATEALKLFLKRLPPEKLQGMVAVTQRALGIRHLYHMSRDNDIRQFSPSISTRTAKGEDRSIPRVSTALDWTGCVLGYQSDINDFLKREPTTNAQGRPVPFTGGWILYGLPFEYAIAPGNHLVPDATRSGEHWLVTYTEDNVDYLPVPLAKIFYETYEQRALPHNHISTKTSVIIEVLTDEPVRLGSGFTIKRGYYRVVVKDLHTAASHRQVDFLAIKEISEVEYLHLKGATAGLLSMDNPVPASMNW